MQEKMNVRSLDDMMDEMFSKVGSEQRNAFRKEAEMYMIGQLIHQARKMEHVTQQQLAEQAGITKSYVSRIERGQVEPSAGLFLRLINALGLSFDIVKPI